MIINKGFEKGDLSKWDASGIDGGDMGCSGSFKEPLIINGYRISCPNGKVLIVHGFIQTPFRMFRLRLKIWWQDKILRRKEIIVRR